MSKSEEQPDVATRSARRPRAVGVAAISAALMFLAACGGAEDPDVQSPTTAATASTDSTVPSTSTPSSTTPAAVVDSTEYVLRSTPIKLPDGRTTWTPLAVDDEVWAAVPSGGIQRLTSEGGAIRMIEMQGGAETPIAAHGLVWVPNRGGDSVTVLSPAGDEVDRVVLDRVDPGTVGPFTPVAGSQGVWVAHPTGYAHITVDGLASEETWETESQVQIVRVGEVVWVLDRRSGAARRYADGPFDDTSPPLSCSVSTASCENATPSPTRPTGPDFSMFAEGGGSLWTVGVGPPFAGALLRLSADDLTISATIQLSPAPAETPRLVAAGDVLYVVAVVQEGPITLWQVDMTAGEERLSDAIELVGTDHLQGLINIMRHDGRIWVTARNNSEPGAVIEYRPATGETVVHDELGRRIDSPTIVGDDLWIAAVDDAVIQILQATEGVN